MHTVVFCAQAYSQNLNLKNEISDEIDLLLRPYVGKFRYEYEIAAFKKEGQYFYALSDVVDTLNLPIDFDNATGRGSGWHGREDWKIIFDLDNENIIFNTIQADIANSHIINKDGFYYIAGQIYQDVMGIGFDANLSRLDVAVQSDYPLPDITRFQRLNREKQDQFPQQSKTRHPRHSLDYDWFDINVANLRLNSRVNNQTTNNVLHRGSIAIEGQLLKQSAYGFVNVDSQNNLNNASLRLFKNAEKANLLGPLKARRYSFGDINMTDIPLTGNATQELGFRFSNTNNENINVQTTAINGNALPNWDIELYRNNILIGAISVDESGFYEFDDVPLFSGNNNFELLFYGPQGEIRYKDVVIPVTAAFLNRKNKSYDISLSLNKTQLYQPNSIKDGDEETPHLSMLYHHSIGDILAYAGYRHRQINQEKKHFFATGFSKILGASLIDTNFGFDEELNHALRLSSRQEIKGWNTSFSSRIQDKAYRTATNSNAAPLQIQANAQKSYRFDKGQRLSTNLAVQYERRANDNGDLYEANWGQSLQMGRFNISNALSYQHTKSDNLVSPIRNAKNDLSFRTYFNQFYVRGGAVYNIDPLKKLERLYTQINYYPRDDLSADIRFDYDVLQDRSRTQLSVNHVNDYFRTSPFISYDNNGDITAGLNLNFDVLDLPYTYKPAMTSERNIGRGIVSAFVYHDKNGNEVFDEGDAAIPDAVVKSVQSKKRSETNDKGKTLLTALPINRATDIELDESTLPDPYMISGRAGYSLYPMQGEIVHFDFPVHSAGEIDGTLSISARESANLRSVTSDTIRAGEVSLYPVYSQEDEPEPRRIKTAFDGFYVATQMPPGTYIAKLSDKTVKAQKAGNPPPRKVEIGYDGNVIYGLNFDMKQRSGKVPVEVEYDENDSADIQLILAIAPKTKTKLLSLLATINQPTQNLYDGLTQLNKPNYYQMAKQEGLDDDAKIEAAHARCRDFNEHAMPCTLIIQMPNKTQRFKTAQR